MLSPNTSQVPLPFPIAISLAHRAGSVFAEAALAVEAANLRLRAGLRHPLKEGPVVRKHSQVSGH